MRYAITITLNPDRCTPIAQLALAFCRQALADGHSIERLFFLAEGVLNGANISKELNNSWNNFIQDNQLDAVVCVASAEKHIVGYALDQNERNVQENPKAPEKNNVNDKTLLSGFGIGGLGQFIDAVVTSDRTITFGS